MATEVFEYADFSGGDYGRLENWRAPKNSFSATNMLLYRSGELGVRPGVRNVTPAGVAVGTVNLLSRLSQSLSAVFYNEGTTLKTFTPTEGSSLSALTGTLANSPGSQLHTDDAGNTVYIASPSGAGGSVTGTTFTSLTNMPAAQAIALYGDRLAVVPVSAKNTVVFSAAASFNNWTISAGNAVSITVGDSDPITALFAQRTHLAILKQNSGLYILTGTPGTNESLRLAARFTGPVGSWGAGRTKSDDKIWFAPTNQQQLSVFDGTNVTLFDNYPLSLYTELAPRAVAPLKLDDQGGAAFVVQANSGVGSSNEVWLRAHGAWTRHTIGATITTNVASAGVGFPQDGGTDVSRLRYGSMLVFTDGGGASASAKFYSWVPFMDRPGMEASPFSTSAERCGDDSSTPVTGTALLAEQRAKDGKEIQVRGVIVDFRSWNTGSATNNHFDLVVNTLNTYESSAPVSSAIASFDEAASQSSLTGSVRSKYFSFGDQGRGGAFNVQLSNVRGVAFQRFRIVTETFPGRV